MLLSSLSRKRHSGIFPSNPWREIFLFPLQGNFLVPCMGGGEGNFPPTLGGNFSFYPCREISLYTGGRRVGGKFPCKPCRKISLYAGCREISLQPTALASISQVTVERIQADAARNKGSKIKEPGRLLATGVVRTTRIVQQTGCLPAKLKNETGGGGIVKHTTPLRLQEARGSPKSRRIFFLATFCQPFSLNLRNPGSVHMG